jgi:hypothetical protein
LKHTSKKNGSAGAAVTAEHMLESPQARKTSGEDWIVRITRLQEALTACPTDILSRCELATILETLEQYEEALFNWKAVLACNANSLKAREGMVRCHERIGRPLPSCL